MFYTKLLQLVATHSNFPSRLVTLPLQLIRWKICLQRIQSLRSKSIILYLRFFTTELGNRLCRTPYQRFYTQSLTAPRSHPQNHRTRRTSQRTSSRFLTNTLPRICRAAVVALVQHRLEAVLSFRVCQHPVSQPRRHLHIEQASIQTSDHHKKFLIMRKAGPNI